MSTSAATGMASGGVCSLHHEVTFSEEHPGSGIVTLVGPAGQPTFVEPELSVAGILRILDPDHLHSAHPLPVCGRFPMGRASQKLPQTENQTGHGQK